MTGPLYSPFLFFLMIPRYLVLYFVFFSKFLLVSFVTVPPADLRKYRKKQGVSVTESVQSEQKEHEQDILELSAQIQDLNKNKKDTPIQPHCCCWHSDSFKSSKRSKRKGGFRKKEDGGQEKNPV